jgi:hypothetical protein
LPLVFADQWHDLVVGDHLPEELKLSEKEKSEKGLKRFFIAHYFLWGYPKNAKMIASRFRIAVHYCQGEPLWKWAKRITAMKSKKISMDNVDGPQHLEIFSITDDGTDFKTNKPNHPTLPRDNGACSKKVNHAAVKYEIAIAVQRAKVVHLAGPFKGGTHDLVMFQRGGLKEKLIQMNASINGIRRTKLCITDRGYRSNDDMERSLFSYPNNMDSKELHNFKSRARLRQETFNGRLKCFAALSAPFRHSFDKHKFVFEAIVVTVQYQMDNGSPIYAV